MTPYAPLPPRLNSSRGDYYARRIRPFQSMSTGAEPHLHGAMRFPPFRWSPGSSSARTAGEWVIQFGPAN
jgi:hypothetical protein